MLLSVPLTLRKRSFRRIIREWFQSTDLSRWIRMRSKNTRRMSSLMRMRYRRQVHTYQQKYLMMLSRYLIEAKWVRNLRSKSVSRRSRNTDGLRSIEMVTLLWRKDFLSSELRGSNVNLTNRLVMKLSAQSLSLKNILKLNVKSNLSNSKPTQRISKIFNKQLKEWTITSLQNLKCLIWSPKMARCW